MPVCGGVAECELKSGGGTHNASEIYLWAAGVEVVEGPSSYSSQRPGPFKSNHLLLKSICLTADACRG